ncbi:nitrite reductase large subunit [Pelagicoccus sp. NFK12]|uniref:Nitrite reductase large subunit n=1 Tax=Pelagicoccus enzymogenes TaxID=2773457 RepID=A0A927IK14_9BACT|nr:nitrite reductase large subunit NirB [Pelagicoccus enzymogenes]MBD5782429.1 nitrite reductase large subunit [Pelagicoccus enzymogenes]
MSKENVVVIGNGMVGCKFLAAMLQKDSEQRFNLITFCEEPRPAYDRVHLSEYFSGKTAEDLTLQPIDWYTDNGITIHLEDKAVSIDREAKLVRSAKGVEVSYDVLVLATGSSPFVPPVPGIEKEGVFVYRTIEDLEGMMEHAKSASKAAVIGGGLLGLEAAKATQDLGLESHVVEFAPRLMPRQIDEAGGEILKDIIESRGLSVHLNKATTEILGDGKVFGMSFKDGSSLEVDMIVVSAGIRPRDELARDCGLEVGPRGGVVVDDKLQTNDPSIFAIGEVALYNNFIYGLVAPGYNMADIVATQITGGQAEFHGADMSTKLKLIGTDVASFGNIEPQEPHRNIVLTDPVKGTYKRLLTSQDGKQLIGGILIGDADAYGNLLQMTLNQIELPEDPIQLILPAGSGTAPAFGPAALPDSAQICSCENVSKGDICSAIENGATTLPALKSCTKAGTGCGGCVPLVTNLLNHTLKELGQEVNTDLCEHFSHTRQGLYEIVRATGIDNFDTLLATHGNGGRGCEICKPAVGSILASVHNDKVIAPRNRKLQDSNDRYLANIQKDGTYSVVPRVPGGEITPEKLIVIGEVANEYGLYTKITGGQRIDLFGAKVNDLPAIWKKLIDAGFESGHAYGKALRTVKSCVGSTWCRFGVQDSTSLAIEVENRYKGIRAPHKIKSAVSGCTRECAEAQSKDFGIIATEKGWNLYLGGNGGMKPRHADLFAADLDKETLIKYIDRYLMFYIKTADKLTRTSVWLDSLEGGIEHLREVIIEDSLGICAELDQQMQHLVDTYHCEWKDAIEDPEKLKRFRHFGNTDESDPTIKHILEREQIRPANEEELAKA